MPMQHSAETRLLAQGYWEGGQSPTEVETTMMRNHGIVLSARTMSDAKKGWAVQESWRDWKLAKFELSEKSNPNLPFGVSNIKDPVFHDCEVIAKRYCRGEASRSGPIRPVIQEALRRVVDAKEPPVAVLDYLAKVVLRPYINNVRKNNVPAHPFDIDLERQAIIDAVKEDE